MTRIALDGDIHPLSEFRAKVKSFIQQVRKTKRPIVITQHGRGTAVIIDVVEYQALLDKLDLLEDISTATKQIEDGKGIDHASAKNRVLSGIRK